MVFTQFDGKSFFWPAGFHYFENNRLQKTKMWLFEMQSPFLVDVQHMFVFIRINCWGTFPDIVFDFCLNSIDNLYKRFMGPSNHFPVSRSPLILSLLMKITCNFSSFSVTINLFYTPTVICCLAAYCEWSGLCVLWCLS